MSADEIFGRGLLLGQILTHCEHILAGGKLAAQVGCSSCEIEFATTAIAKEGCRYRVEGDLSSGRVSVWMFKKEIADILIDSLRDAGTGVAAQIVAGKLFGYSDHDIEQFVAAQNIPLRARAVFE